MLAMALVVGGISVATYPVLPRKYSATAEVLLHPTNQEGGTSWDQSICDVFDDSAIQTKIDILRSDALQANVVEEHNLLADPEFNRALKPSWLRRMVNSQPWLTPWIPPQRGDLAQVRAKLASHLIVKRGKLVLHDDRLFVHRSAQSYAASQYIGQAVLRRSNQAQSQVAGRSVEVDARSDYHPGDDLSSERAA